MRDSQGPPSAARTRSKNSEDRPKWRHRPRSQGVLSFPASMIPLGRGQMGIGNGGRDFVIGRCLISCVIIIGMVSTPGVAQMQPGSTGGTIGKVDKSISGGGDVEQPNSTASRRSLSKSENRSSETSASGRWRWHAGCGIGGQWHGVFQISQTADGSFTGTFTSDASDSGAAANPVPQQIQSGRVSGGQISFTRVIAPAQQWTGTISPASGETRGMMGSIAALGLSICSWTATR